MNYRCDSQVSERRACKVVGQNRSIQRRAPRERKSADLDEEITQLLRAFALENKRQGYKKAFRYVIDRRYHVNIKKVRSLWRQAGLKVPYKKKRKSSSGHGQPMGYHVPLEKNVSWALDFQFDQTTDTRTIKILNIIDEYSREALASVAARSIDSLGVIAVLDDLAASRGHPIYIRCDNGP